jgi:hypothetical protein
MLKKALLIALLWLCVPASGKAMQRYWNYCQKGGYNVTTQGLQSSNLFQQTFASCTVHVYLAGTTTLATLYSDNLSPTPTPLANPFTSAADGYFEFYATGGRYDVELTSSTGTPQYTWGDISLCDPFGPNADSACTPGGTGAAHNLLSTTHLDTIPASPPVRGDIITAQNQTSPTGVNPSWARLPLGTAKQCVTSDGTDAKWDGCWWNIYNNGSLVGTEQGLNFIPGTNITFSPFSDNSGTKSVDLTLNSVVQVQNNGTAVGAEPIINFIPGTNITLTPFTDSGGKINLTINSTGGGGGGTDCSTTAAGIWDIIPQTCAGEKTLQGLSGNPTDINFTVIPPSDQEVANTWSGLGYSSFTNPDSGTLGDFLKAGDNVLTMLNGGAITGSNPDGFESALTIYSQDDTKGGYFGILGQHTVCLADDPNSGDTIGNEQCIVGHAYNTSAGSTQYEDAISAFADYSGTGTVSNLATIFAGTPTNSAYGNATATYGILMQGNYSAACAPGGCYDWFSEGSNAYLDSDGNISSPRGVSSGYMATGAAHGPCFATTSPSFNCGLFDYPKIFTIIAAGATTESITVAPLWQYPHISIEEDSTIGASLGVTCNTTPGRTYSVSAKTTGEIFSAEIGNPGSGYAVNDTGTISGGSGGTYKVTFVGGGGTVTGVLITAAGTGYPESVVTPQTTSATSGAGTGLTLFLNQVGGSFTVTSSVAPSTDPACLNILVTN